MPPRTLQPNQISELVVANRDGTEKQVVYTSSDLIEAPNWSPDGKWLVYNSNGRLFRLPPDGGTAPEQIDSGALTDMNNDHVISPCGTWFFVTSADGHLYRLPFGGGTPERVSNDHDPARGFRYYLHGISPDGETLAYVGLERQGDGIMTRICTLSLTEGTDTYLTDGACPVDGPEYSPDGQWIWFNSEAAATRPGHAQVFKMRPDGSDLTQLTHDARVNWFPHEAPDGSIVVYLSYPEGTQGHPPDKDVLIRSMTPDGADMRDIDRFNGGQGTINVPSWSPDSRHFAYVRYPMP